MSSRDTAAVGLTCLQEFRGPRPLNAPRQARTSGGGWALSSGSGSAYGRDGRGQARRRSETATVSLAGRTTSVSGWNSVTGQP